MRYYPVVNDLIGGYDVSIHNKTVGDHDHEAGEHTIGSFMSKAHAELVAHALNYYMATYFPAHEDSRHAPARVRVIVEPS